MTEVKRGSFGTKQPLKDRDGALLGKARDKSEKNRKLVVNCEKIWVHRDDLAKYEVETKRSVRPMPVPFILM